jgi:hypothetical protein
MHRKQLQGSILGIERRSIRPQTKSRAKLVFHNFMSDNLSVHNTDNHSPPLTVFNFQKFKKKSYKKLFKNSPKL